MKQKNGMKTMERKKQKIFDDYAAYLKKNKITYHDNQGFSVRFDLKNAGVTFIDVIDTYDGRLEVFDYIGNCNTGVRAANRLVKTFKEHYPGYDIWADKYTTFEIDVAQKFEFTTTEDLHERVCRLAEIVDAGFVIGKEILGESFYR